MKGGAASYLEKEKDVAEAAMKNKNVRKILNGVAAGACYLAVAAVLLVFAWRLGCGVREVKRGEATPADMLAELADWMTGRESP